MKTKMRGISCLCALIIATTLWAEEGPASPQSDATAGLNPTEVDQFMSTTEWGEAKFDKAFTYAGFEQGNQNTLDLGVAFKAGTVYIGSWYKGNLGTFRGSKGNKVTTDIEPLSPGILGNKKTNKGYTLNKDYTADHSAAMLLGFGNMGIKFGYQRSGSNQSGKVFNGLSRPDSIIKNSATGGINATVYSPKGYINRTTHKPFVEFGMNVALGGMTLSPTAALEVAINQNSDYGLRTITKKTSDVNYSIVKKAAGYNNSYLGITGKLGMGLALGDALHSSFKFGYELTGNAYGKTYTDASGKTHKVRGNYNITTDEAKDEYNVGSSKKRVLTNTFKADFYTNSYYTNKLSLEYSMQKDFTDRLSLFAGVECPITVTAEKKITKKVDKTTIKTINLNPADSHKDNIVVEERTAPVQTDNSVSLAVSPKIKAAITYAALPNRLFLSLGSEVAVLGGSYTRNKTTYDSFVETETKVTTNADGSVKKETKATDTSKEESVSHISTQDPVKAELKGGLRWNIVDNVAFDLVYTQSLNAALIELTKLGNLKLACTVKF